MAQKRPLRATLRGLTAQSCTIARLTDQPARYPHKRPIPCAINRCRALWHHPADITYISPENTRRPANAPAVPAIPMESTRSPTVCCARHFPTAAGAVHRRTPHLRKKDGPYCMTAGWACITTHHHCGVADGLRRAVNRSRNTAPARQPNTSAGCQPFSRTRQTLENIQHAEILPTLRPTSHTCNTPLLACNVNSQGYRVHVQARPAIPFSPPRNPSGYSRR